jgi:hypothetical protein
VADVPTKMGHDTVPLVWYAALTMVPLTLHKDEEASKGTLADTTAIKEAALMVTLKP